MATKRLSRTAIEGGRARGNKWARRYSHREERAHVRDVLHKACVDPDLHDALVVEPRRSVGKWFYDKLGPARRWLRAQAGRPWSEVYSDLKASFDPRTTAGRHLIYDHMLHWVARDPRIERPWFRPELTVDNDGILRREPLTRRQRSDDWSRLYGDRSRAARWAAGRKVGARGAVLFWFLPVVRRDEVTGFRQGGRLDAAEREAFLSFHAQVRDELSFPTEGGAPRAAGRSSGSNSNLLSDVFSKTRRAAQRILRAVVPGGCLPARLKVESPSVSDDDRLAEELEALRIPRHDEPKRNGRGAGLPTGAGRRPGGLAWLIAVAVGVGIVGTAFLVLREGQGRFFPQEVELGSVTLMSPSQTEVTLVASGYVHTRHKATVAPKITGRLDRLLVAEGDLVKEGQLIAELDAGDAQAQLAQVRAEIAAARAKVEQARAQLTDAQMRFAREDDLLKRGAGTQMAFDDAKARKVTAEAQLQAAQADVRAVEARLQAVQVALDNTKVKAPFAATVVRKIAEEGEVLSPLATTGTGIVTLADLTDLEVHADVSESQYGKVKAATPAEILLDAFPDRRFRGQVSDIRQSVDRAKASITVKVRFQGDVTGVLPDMAAKVSFLQKPLEDVELDAKPILVVPDDAVVERDGRKVVLTIQDERVHEVPVTPGEKRGQLRELAGGGVSPGARVIRHPPTSLREGAAVKEKKK